MILLQRKKPSNVRTIQQRTWVSQTTVETAAAPSWAIQENWEGTRYHQLVEPQPIKGDHYKFLSDVIVKYLSLNESFFARNWSLFRNTLKYRCESKNKKFLVSFNWLGFWTFNCDYFCSSHGPKERFASATLSPLSREGEGDERKVQRTTAVAEASASQESPVADTTSTDSGERACIHKLVYWWTAVYCKLLKRSQLYNSEQLANGLCITVPFVVESYGSNIHTRNGKMRRLAVAPLTLYTLSCFLK